MSINEKIQDWNLQLYLKYKNERTQPSIDLVSRIKIDNPGTVIDLGCGPGNSTQILYQRWPESKITGLDNSPEMIKKAKTDYPDQKWILSDISDTDLKVKYDIVFSNAVIQWIPDHEELIEKLFSITADGGALAVQVPMFKKMAMGRSIEQVSKKEKWNHFTKGCDEMFTYHDYGFYYDLLGQCSSDIDIWETAYVHTMDSHESILEWIRSTGLKPYLDSIDNVIMKNEFEAEILEEIKKNYPIQKNGKVLFPFKRLFFVAYKI